MELEKLLLANQTVCVVDSFFGDSGKGRVIDDLPFLITEGRNGFKVFYRPGGGANTGHTVFIGDQKYVFHIIPSGALIKDSECLIGRGVLFDPFSFQKELDMIGGINLRNTIKIDYAAHVTMPWHIALDVLREDASGSKKVGTTGKGIGPTIESRDRRKGFITVQDLEHINLGKLSSKIEEAVNVIEPELTELMAKCHISHFSEGGIQPFLGKVKLADGTSLLKFFDEGKINQEEVLKKYYMDKLSFHIADTHEIAMQHVKKGNKILGEATQGALLDVIHGTYPYVTAASTTRSGLEHDAGIFFDLCVSVVKAYATRVGSGPFPTELNGEIATKLREAGKEYGASTGRPRRVGWLDGVALRHTMDLNYRKNEPRVIALTKLDVLEGFSPRLCTGYYLPNKRDINYYNTKDVHDASMGTYIDFGEIENIKDVNKIRDMTPSNARRYLEEIERIADGEVMLIGKGAKRGDIIVG